MGSKIELICGWCGNPVLKEVGEVKRQRKRKGEAVKFFCDRTCSIRYGNHLRGNRVFDIEKTCPHCGNKFNTTNGKHEKTHCSKACANKHCMTEDRKNKARLSQTQEKRLQQSIKSKALYDDPEYLEKVSKRFKEKTHFTSKHEMYIRDYFIKAFLDDNWTYGGNLKYNDQILVRDLFSKKLKVCIEYDGIQHFKDIHHQLEKKQRKDLALELQCIENGWRLIRIDEDVYLKDTDYWLCELIRESYFGEDQVVKFGLRY